ncbi:MAG TPA: TolC family protein [Anaeromyxobacteraceae bacterium]|jgi:outer membrane protein TolC
MLLDLLTGLALGASACGPLDLDTALALAAARSDEVAIREAEVSAAHADEALAAALRVLPSASATLLLGPAPRARGSVTDSPDDNRSLRHLGPFGRAEVQAVQPLYTFGRLEAAADAARAGVRAREALAGDTAAQVQLRVVQLWWGTALARRLLAVAADVAEALDEAERRVDKALESGDGEVVPADRQRLRLFRGQLRLREAEARKGLELARLALAATLGLEPARLSLREEPLEAPPGSAPDEARALADAERRRPDLRALDAAIAAREAEVRSEEAARWPQLFLAGVFRYGLAPNRDIQRNPWVHDDFNLLEVGAAVGLRQDLALSLLSARAEKARAERATLLLQRAGLARLVRVQVSGTLAELRAAQVRAAAARDALAAGRALFRAVRLDFAAGLVEARILLESYALFVQSQLDAAQADHDLLVARARLDQVTGEPPRRSATCEP